MSESMLRPPRREPDADVVASYGLLVGYAFGLNTEWHAKARCKDWRRANPLGPNGEGKRSPWVISTTIIDVLVDGVSARELVELALFHCQACPVQYACARYAVEGEMRASTWAMPIQNLIWLQKQPDALEIIDIAEDAGEPVQVIVRDFRSARS